MPRVMFGLLGGLLCLSSTALCSEPSRLHSVDDQEWVLGKTRPRVGDRVTNRKPLGRCHHAGKRYWQCESAGAETSFGHALAIVYDICADTLVTVEFIFPRDRTDLAQTLASTFGPSMADSGSWLYYRAGERNDVFLFTEDMIRYGIKNGAVLCSDK